MTTYLVTISAPDSYPDADERLWSARVEAESAELAEEAGKRRFIEMGAPDDIDWDRWIVTVTEA
jgi:hypothetical protein